MVHTNTKIRPDLWKPRDDMHALAFPALPLFAVLTTLEERFAFASAAIALVAPSTVQCLQFLHAASAVQRLQALH